MYDCIIVDLLNLYHRNYNTHSEFLHTIGGRTLKTGGIYGSLISIQKIERELLNPNGIIYFCADNPISKIYERKGIDPDYKLNRTKQSDEFYKGLNYLSLILQNYNNNYFYLCIPKVEADDHVPSIIRMQPKSSKILVYSGDMDWARAIDFEGYSVDWHNSKEVVSQIDFEKKYGFRPNSQNIISYKCYRGDDVDNIPIGLPNIRTDTLLQLIEYGTIYEVRESLDYIDFLNPEWKRKFLESFPRLNLNYQLLDFLSINEIAMKHYLTKCRFNPGALKIFYRTLGFDIGKVDPRLYNYFVDREAEKAGFIDDFFQMPKIPRI